MSQIERNLPTKGTASSGIFSRCLRAHEREQIYIPVAARLVDRSIKRQDDVLFERNSDKVHIARSTSPRKQSIVSFNSVTVRTTGLIDMILNSFLPVCSHQMAPDPNEQIALSFNAEVIIEEIRSKGLPDNQQLANTLLIMLMPKGKHKLTDFWTKPETFIRQIIPFLIRFPVVHDNMLKAVAADQRLSSQAGVCGIDFTEVIAELGMSASPSTSISFNIHLVLTSIFVFQVPCWIPGKWRKPESSPVTSRVKSSKINSATITARRIALFLFRPSTTDSPSWS